MKKYSILTYIFNNYEIVREIENPDPECEYILVTDNKNLKSNTWKIVYDEKLDNMSPFDKCYWVRFHAKEYIKTDIVLRMDHSMKILDGIKLSKLINIFISNEYDIIGVPHPITSNILYEYNYWVMKRGYKVEQAKKQIEFFKTLRYNFNCKGMIQGGFIIENIKNQKTNFINEMTYNVLKLIGENDIIDRLDQTVYSVIANHFFIDKLKILPLSNNNIFDSSVIIKYDHNTLIKCPQNEYDHDVFGKEVWCLNKRVKAIDIEDIVG